MDYDEKRIGRWRSSCALRPAQYSLHFAPRGPDANPKTYVIYIARCLSNGKYSFGPRPSPATSPPPARMSPASPHVETGPKPASSSLRRAIRRSSQGRGAHTPPSVAAPESRAPDRAEADAGAGDDGWPGPMTMAGKAPMTMAGRGRGAKSEA